MHFFFTGHIDYRNTTQEQIIHEAAPAQNPPGPGRHRPHFWMSYVYVFSVRRDRGVRGAIYFDFAPGPDAAEHNPTHVGG